MSQLYEQAEISQQNGKNGKPCWLIIKGNVYDVTSFLSEHPGGGELLLEYGGKDATKAFKQAGHSSDAEKDLKQYKIGEVSPIQVQPKAQVPTVVVNPPPLPAVKEAQKSSSGFCCC